LLAETFGHPMYLGVKGAREILKVLNKKLNLNIDLNELDKEIKELEKEISKQSTEDIADISKLQSLKKFRGIDNTNYIG
jgi:proteasome assembly chaperone (PAC2) family protein